MRWATPAVGLAVTFLAWRRFRSPGTGLAFVGFLVMLSGPVVRTIWLLWLRDATDVSAREISVALTFAGLVGGIGLVLVVLSIRRLIAAAGKNADHELEQQGMATHD